MIAAQPGPQESAPVPPPQMQPAQPQVPPPPQPVQPQVPPVQQPVQPQQTYVQPQMPPPQQSYGPQQQAYGPQQTYGPQQQAYGPQQTYGPQQQAYGPQQTYGPQQQAYGPQQTYGPQPQMQPQMQQGYGPVPQPQKKSALGLVLGLVGGVIAIAALVAVLIFTGVFKDNRTRFAEQIVGMSENITREVPEAGLGPIRALLHLDKDDTKDSHTTTRTTEIYSDMTGDETYELIQSYSYDASSGDTAYDLTVNAGSTALGTGSIYFHGDEFLFAPMSASAGMIRYEMDKGSAKALKDYGAVDRYALMLLAAENGGQTDWDAAKETFLTETLAGFDKSEFKKDKEAFTILGKEEQCKTVSVKATGDKALQLLEGINELIIGEYVDPDEYEDKKEYMNLFRKLYKETEEDPDELTIIVTTFAYKGTPAALRILAATPEDNYRYELSFYEKDVERQMTVRISSDFEDGDFTLEDTVIAQSGGSYVLTTQADYGDLAILLKQEGKIKGDDRDLSGSFEVTPGDRTGISLGDSVSGTMSEHMKNGSGEIETTIKSEQGSFTLHTAIEREKLQKEKITPPEFIEESGVDCVDIDDLRDTVHMKGNLDYLKIDNSILRLANAFALMGQGASLF